MGKAGHITLVDEMAMVKNDSEESELSLLIKSWSTTMIQHKIKKISPLHTASYNANINDYT